VDTVVGDFRMLKEVVVSFRRSGNCYEVFFNSTKAGTFSVPEEFRSIKVVKFSELDDLGDRLGEALFGGSLLLEGLFREVQSDSRLVFEFQKGTETLLVLPWEFVKHPHSGKPISLEIPFVRRIGEGAELEPIEGRPLRVLVIISEPLTQVSFDARRFHDIIVQEAKWLVDEGLLQLEFLSLPSTPDSLARRLLERAPDVVHFIGHGDVGVLLLEAEDGSESRIEAVKFNALLKEGKLRLVILTACYSGAVHGEDLVSGTATALVQAGVPSIVAMQLPILVEAAYRMVGDLYAGFLKEPFDDLVKRLRVSRFFAERRRAPSQWGIPVFYLQDVSERLLEGVSKGKSSLKEWPPVSLSYRLPERAELFVGRKNLLVKTNKALIKNKVVVLRGLSGMGKSFLARELCHWHKLRGNFPGGIIWLNLEAGGSYATVLERIGLDLSIAEFSEESLRSCLGLVSTLLVLDSFEKVRTDSELAQFLGDFPEVSRVLLTTREGVDIGATVSVWEMNAEDAFEFFCRRAEKAGWNGIGREYVPEICGELGYMPLAIELISPQAASVPMKDLLNKVRSSLSAIAAERPDLPLRHRKVEAALRVSYDPLKPQEKLVLSRMSVFRGDAFHEHVSEVIEVSNVVNILRGLHTKGLVLFERERYRLHHIVRRFSLERLERDFQEREKYEKRLASFFSSLVEWGVRALETEEAAHAVTMTQLELQNFRGAQQWFFEKKRFVECTDLSIRLGSLFQWSGLWRSRVEIALLSVEAAKQRGDRETLSMALHSLGLAYEDIGDLDNAEKYCKRSLKIVRQIDGKKGIASVLHSLGVVEELRRNLKEAEDYYNESLKIAQKNGYADVTGACLHHLGRVEMIRGDLERAEEYCKRGLKIAENLDDKFGIGSSLYELGRIRLLNKDLEGAEDYCRKSLEVAKRIGYAYGIASNYVILAGLFEMKGKYEDAAEFYAEAAYVFHEIGAPDEKLVLSNLARMLKLLGRKKVAKLLKKKDEKIWGYVKDSLMQLDKVT